MKTGNPTHHRTLWKSPQGIVGAALLIIGLVVIGPQIWACVCECYYNTDCASGERCDREGCDQTTVNGKLRKGLCKKDGTIIIGDQTPAALSLHLWIESFAQAGANGGGEPNAQLLAQALAQPLSAEQHEAIRDVALGVVDLALGSTAFPDEFHANGGMFASPQVVAIPGEPCGTTTELDNGLVAPLDSVHLAALRIIRDAVVGELYQPGLGILEAELDRLALEQPAYDTFGVCEFPHIMEGMYRFENGTHCLQSELRAMVYSLLAQPPAHNSLGQRGLRRLVGAP